MPHFILSYSTDLKASHNIPALERALFDTAAESGVFDDITSIKFRSQPFDSVIVGTPDQAFAHLEIRLLSGRNTETKRALALTCLSVLETHLPNVTSLSVDPVDIDISTYVKRGAS